MPTISSAEIVATLIEFHSQVSTGNGGCTSEPSGAWYGMPSASCQCSRLIVVGIRLPVAKLPGRSEIDTTASSGNSVTARKPHSSACAATTRQRACLPRTMAMVRASL